MKSCNNCPSKPADNLCVQYLGEACGWKWMNRTDESADNCHYNYTEESENDPYAYIRKKGDLK